MKSQTDAFGVELLGVLDETEEFEQLLLVAFLYADAVVDDLDFECPVLGFVHTVHKLWVLESEIVRSLQVLGFDIDLSSSGCELDRIGDQVENNLLKSVLICANLVID